MMAAMNLRATLQRGCIIMDLRATTKDEVLAEMVGRLAEGGLVPDPDRALAAVRQREAQMSTGMQYSVAVPHGRVEGLDELVTALAIKRDGLDFDALDGEPSRIFVMTLSPALKVGPHMQYLAEIGRLLSCPSVREAILKAETPAAVVDLLTT